MTDEHDKGGVICAAVNEHGRPCRLIAGHYCPHETGDSQSFRRGYLPGRAPKGAPDVAAPKVRDESEPPPGWRLESDGSYFWRPENDADTLSEAWAIYDAEHGHAPSVAAPKVRDESPGEAMRSLGIRLGMGGGHEGVEWYTEDNVAAFVERREEHATAALRKRCDDATCFIHDLRSEHAASVAALQERVRELGELVALENEARNWLLADYWALRDQLAAVTRDAEVNRLAYESEVQRTAVARAELAAASKRVAELEIIEKLWRQSNLKESGLEMCDTCMNEIDPYIDQYVYVDGRHLCDQCMPDSSK